MVPYDGSESAKNALKLAQDHGKVWNAKIFITNAISRELPLKHAFVEETEKKLEDEINALFVDCRLPYETNLLLGSPDIGEQLVNFAKREGIDLIYLGVIRQSKVGKFLFGSTAQHVILRAPCPVVTIR